MWTNPSKVKHIPHLIFQHIPRILSQYSVLYILKAEFEMKPCLQNLLFELIRNSLVKLDPDWRAKTHKNGTNVSIVHSKHYEKESLGSFFAQTESKTPF